MATTRHAQGNLVQLHQYFGKPITSIMAYSTLNQKFGIEANTVLNVGEDILTQYVGIGNGGAFTSANAQGALKLVSSQHLTSHTGLYNQLPYVVRDIANDLTPVERAKYRMRVPFTTSLGASKVAYYLKKIDLTLVTTPVLEQRQIVNNAGVTSTVVTPFAHVQNDLTPTAVQLTNTQAIQVGAKYVAASCMVPFSLTAEESVEFSNACAVIFGDTGYDSITDIALVSGVDRNITTVGGLTYTEAIQARVMSSYPSILTPTILSGGFSMDLKVSVVDGLLEIIEVV